METAGQAGRSSIAAGPDTERSGMKGWDAFSIPCLILILDQATFSTKRNKVRTD